jgi:hypothetical protein
MANLAAQQAKLAASKVKNIAIEKRPQEPE